MKYSIEFLVLIQLMLVNSQQWTLLWEFAKMDKPWKEPWLCALQNPGTAEFWYWVAKRKLKNSPRFVSWL
jgi:hypothetical protein